MIIKKYMYECIKCKDVYLFEVGKPFSTKCPICENEMQFERIYDCDTDLAEKVRNTPPYDPTEDPKSPYYIPKITCPYCQSTSTTKITTTGRMFSTGLLGLGSSKIGKQWHCNKCKSDF